MKILGYTFLPQKQIDDMVAAIDRLEIYSVRDAHAIDNIQTEMDVVAATNRALHEEVVRQRTLLESNPPVNHTKSNDRLLFTLLITAFILSLAAGFFIVNRSSDDI
jgi:hypothetical protein